MKCLRESGGVVNSAIVMAEGIVSHNSNLLQENGGGRAHCTCAKSFLSRIGYVKRRTSTKAKVSVAEFDAYNKAQFVFDIMSIIEMEEIPPDLLLTGITRAFFMCQLVIGHYLAEKGSNRVEKAGVDDKRQITAVFAGTRNGNFYYLCRKTQEMFSCFGRIPRQLACVTHTENHRKLHEVDSDVTPKKGRFRSYALPSSSSTS